VKLGDHAVILGENKVGKTNLLFALRLFSIHRFPIPHVAFVWMIFGTAWRALYRQELH
jgi:hypothetical protein